MITLYCINWTAISAITSAVMAIITLITLVVSSCQNKKLRKQNDDQLKEVKRQWEEENRPYLEASIVRSAYVYARYELEIKNIGKKSAESIRFQFDDDFLITTGEEYRKYFEVISSNDFKILPNEIKRYRLIDNSCVSNGDYMVGNKRASREICEKIVDYLKTKGLNISISYNDQYSFYENLVLDENKVQTLTTIDALSGISLQLSFLRMDYKTTEK